METIDWRLDESKRRLRVKQGGYRLTSPQGQAMLQKRERQRRIHFWSAYLAEDKETEDSYFEAIEIQDTDQGDYTTCIGSTQEDEQTTNDKRIGNDIRYEMRGTKPKTEDHSRRKQEVKSQVFSTSYLSSSLLACFGYGNIKGKKITPITKNKPAPEWTKADLYVIEIDDKGEGRVIKAKGHNQYGSQEEQD